MSHRTRINVLYGIREEYVSWYEGTTSLEIERLIRQIFNIPPEVTPMLRDLQGDHVVINPNLPDGRTFTLFTIPKGSTGSPSKSYLSPGTASYVGSSATASLGSPARLAASSLASPRHTSSPAPLDFGSATPSSARSYSLYPVSGSPARSSSLSASSSAASTSSPGVSLAKQVLDRVDKLRGFERRVRDLRQQKLDDFFQLSMGEWVWRRDVTLNEFMQAISSDLYWNAGACGLLSSNRRGEVDRILNAALSAYLDYVRELGRQGNFEPIVNVKAQYAREALAVSYDAVQRIVNDIIGERLREAEVYSSSY